MGTSRVKYHLIRRHAFVLVVPLVAILAVLVAACGASDSGTSTGSGSSGSGSNPTPAPTSVKGYGTTYGCPSDVVVNSGAQPNVVITLKDSNTTINAKTGDVIEVQLPFGQQWTGPATVPGILQMQTPSGYAVKTAKVCVWRFNAQSSGTAQISFSGKAICKAGEMCPQYVMAVLFTIDIK